MECPHCHEELTVPYCEECGSQGLPGDKFCENCGHELSSSPVDESEMVVCPECERKLLPGGSFCVGCGHQLEEIIEEDEGVIQHCTSCGHEIGQEDNYCSSCGEPLAEAAAEEFGEDYDPGERRACSDGMCIGIIGPDGRCTECGKPADGVPETEETPETGETTED